MLTDNTMYIYNCTSCMHAIPKPVLSVTW